MKSDITLDNTQAVERMPALDEANIVVKRLM
jgi:hypothetical protein